MNINALYKGLFKINIMLKSIEITEETFIKLTALAKKEGRNLKNYIEYILAKHAAKADRTLVTKK